MKLAFLFVAGVLAAPSALAQKPERPATWKLRLDAGHAGMGTDSLFYVSMPPGWHVTTKAHAGILWDPAWAASGDYRVTATFFLFPGSRRDGYGVFFGGKDLESDGQRYAYVLLRSDGKYLVKAREGSATPVITPWTTHSSVAKLDSAATENIKNVLVLEVRSGSLKVMVNGQEVATVAPATLGAYGDGIVGLRMNHGLDVHVSALKIEPLK